MSAAQGLALKLRAAPASGGRRAPRGRIFAACGPASRQRYGSGGVSLDGGFLRLPAAVARAAPRAPRASSSDFAAEEGAEAPLPPWSMSKIPESSIGLYDPSFERDSCGVGFIAELSAEYSRKTVSARDTPGAGSPVLRTKRPPCGVEVLAG